MSSGGRRWRDRLVALLRERAFHVVLAVVIPVSIAGYLHGIAAPGRVGAPGAPEPAPWAVESDTDIELAPSYAQLTERRQGANRNWDTQIRSRPVPAPEDALEPAEAEAAMRRARAERRAYEGAPPVIPHPIDERRQACLTCHETGWAAGELVAPPMSHRPLVSCTQCHAPTERSAEGPPVAANAFSGRRLTSAPPLPWPGAPPVIPHPTAMRTQCLSCHGSGGAQALRSPHPERVSCTQCHAPTQSFDLPPAMR